MSERESSAARVSGWVARPRGREERVLCVCVVYARTFMHQGIAARVVRPMVEEAVRAVAARARLRFGRILARARFVARGLREKGRRLRARTCIGCGRE